MRAALALALLLSAQALAGGPCGHGVAGGAVAASGEPEPLDASLLRCPEAEHANLAAYVGELEGAFGRFLRFYTALSADLELAQQGLAAHCARCEAAIADAAAAGYGVGPLGASSPAGAAAAQPSGCAAAASSCPTAAFCVDRYRSPTGVHECSLKLVDVRDACSLGDGGPDPCSAAAELGTALAFMRSNLLERYPLIVARLGSLRERTERGMREGAVDAATSRAVQAELDAVLEEVRAASRPVGGMDILAFQRAVAGTVATLASEGLREDVSGRRSSHGAAMVRLVADERAVAAFCLSQNMATCAPVLERARACCDGFGVEGCPSASDGAGGSARAQSAFCTSFGLCREEAYGRQVSDSDADPWSPNLLRLLDELGSASRGALFVNETACLGSRAAEPAPPDPCERLCLECFGARRAHCHPQTATCVCELGGEWRRTAASCRPEPQPAVDACCRRLLPEGGPAALVEARGEGSCALAEIAGVSYDRCQAVRSPTGWCCRLGLREVAADEGCVAGGPTCATACTQLARGDRAIDERCRSACEGADASCEAACLGGPAERLRSCLGGCSGLPQGALECAAGCAGSREAELCARMCRAKAPALDVATSLLVEGQPAQAVAIGSRPSASASVRNLGILPFSGRVEHSLVSLEGCRCPPCPPERPCECGCRESRAAPLASGPLGPVAPGAAGAHASPPLGLEAPEGSYVRAAATVRDASGQAVAAALGPIALIGRAPDAFVLSGRFLSGGRPVTKAYPGMTVVGEVALSTRVAPLNVTLAVLAAGRRVGAAASTLLGAAEPRAVLQTAPLVVREEWAGLVLGLEAEAKAGGLALIEGQLPVRSGALSACSAATLTTACRDALASGGRSFPAAYVEVLMPRLEVTEARFSAGEAAAVRLDPGEQARGEAVVRNLALVPFEGAVELESVALPSDGLGEGRAVATGGELVRGLATGQSATVRTSPFPVRDGTQYGLRVRARDASGLAWADGLVGTAVLPSAQLAGGAEEVEGERADIEQDIEAGACALAVRCASCLPSCVLRVDVEACRIDTRRCACSCRVTRYEPQP